MILHRIVIVVYPDMQVLDVAGPAEVFGMAGFLGAEPTYEVVIVSPDGRPVRGSSGVTIVADASFSEELASGNRIDTLMVVGGVGVHAIAADRPAVGALSRLVDRGERVTSVCAGAFFLAETGVLDGRRATTHWILRETMTQQFPAIGVDLESIFVRDDHVWTAAGGSAGIDLALALVAEDHGDRIANEVAAWLVASSRRPGGQAQFSATLEAQSSESSEFDELVAWLPQHLNEDLSVAALAARVHMSARSFSRVFVDALGVTPGVHVQRLRVETACTLLATTALSVGEIARAVGYGRAETFNRAFRRATATSPTTYREEFSSV